MTEHTDNGFYGKLPALGDFVQRRLPAAFIHPWDQWLQEGLATSRAQLGGDWLDLYLTSPLWRFALSPGIAGQGAWTGVLMPSVDRVGRYFPLTLACPLPPEANVASLLGRRDWYERTEQLALTVLEDGFDLDAFDAALCALSSPRPRIEHDPSGDAIDAWQVDASRADGLDGACPVLLSRALREVFLSYTIWWTGGSEHVAPSLLCCQGLPTPEATTALITGDWSPRDWLRLGAL
jgi:type VI secretion system protein ImpM